MSSFSSYVLQFMKNTDKHQTHLSFNRGKYNVPDDKFEEFYEQYYKAIVSNTDIYLIEKIYNTNFAFFLDLDQTNDNKKLNDTNVKEIVKILENVINKIIIVKDTDVEKMTENIISKSDDKYHINYYNLIVNSDIANVICEKLKEYLKENIQSEINLHECIDTSVYRTGLRMLGSKKSIKSKKDKNNIYKIYDLENGEYTELENMKYKEFIKTIIRKKQNTTICDIKEEYINKSQVVKSKAVVLKGVDEEVGNEIASLLNDIKLTTECLKDTNIKIQRTYAKPNKMGMFCYYVSIEDKYCPFKLREHKRETSPLYFEISLNGIYLKCHDQDCLRRKFPEKGISLPIDFETRYSKIYKSMSTKYWKTDITITPETKVYLEESLNGGGTHYQIAKAAFNIFKDRFRVDDIKNTTWFEFDGVRWLKSNLMNILISEELPKYYRGIKIRDTSVENEHLQDYLANSEKFDTNLRNQMVDMIITKLENVNFKNNITTQLSYIFKNYDSDFYINLDENPQLVGFKNGVYDFQKNSFRQCDQYDYLTFSTGYEYVEYDENNEYIKEIYEFLEKIITNKDVREYLLKVLGKSLVGIPEEKFYIWTGLSGANGKSTLVNLLEQTLGDYITSVDVSLLTNKRASSSNASPDIIRLKGKRMFTFQEPEHDDKLRTGILKQFTGGDTIIARELFKAPITFKLQGQMIMCCNDLPAVASIDGGTWRRIRVIEFKSRFCDNPVKANEFAIDPNLKTKMKTWRPYFMSILIHWYNKYLYEGMHEPDEVKKATNKYKVDNDKFNEYFDQNIEEDATQYESNKSIYNNFTSWWSCNYPTSRLPDIKEVIRAIKIKYGNEKEKVINGSLHYGFNIRLKNSLDDNIDYDL